MVDEGSCVVTPVCGVQCTGVAAVAWNSAGCREGISRNTQLCPGAPRSTSSARWPHHLPHPPGGPVQGR